MSFPSVMKAPLSHFPTATKDIHSCMHSSFSLFLSKQLNLIAVWTTKKKKKTSRGANHPSASCPWLLNSNCESCDSFHLTHETEPFTLTNNASRATGHCSKVPPLCRPSTESCFCTFLHTYSKSFTLPSASATLQSWSANTGVEHIENGKQQN